MQAQIIKEVVIEYIKIVKAKIYLNYLNSILSLSYFDMLRVIIADVINLQDDVKTSMLSIIITVAAGIVCLVCFILSFGHV